MVEAGSGNVAVRETACDIELALEPPFPLEGGSADVKGQAASVPESHSVQVPEAPKGKRWSVGTLTYTTGGLAVLFFWLLWGDFSWSMRDRAIGPVLQIMLKKFQASDFLAGMFMTALPSAIGLILGPVISCWSDRFRSGWGRRIPFILIPTPFIVASMVGLAFSPVVGRFINDLLGLAPSSLNFTIVLTIGSFWVLFDLATAVSNTVFGGLINDVVPHPVIGRFYGLFRALSLIAGIIFNYAIIGGSEESYAMIFLGVGALYGAGVTSMCFKVREGDYPTPPPLAGGGLHPVKAVKSYFRECFSSLYYCCLFAMISLNVLASMAAFTFSVYAAQSFGLSMERYGVCLAITYACSLALAYPIGSLADRFHPLRVGIAAMVIHTAITLCGFLFIASPVTFSLIFVVQGVCAGTCGTATAGLLPMLLPKGRFSQFASACGFVTSIGVMVMGPALGWFLDFNGHQYAYTFGAAFVFSALALVAGLLVYRQFLALGGVRGYVAPEPESSVNR